ncbi:MAG: TM2 domain-containing protein [Lachnospiraceae bacterium]|nr:TM2 domain-containing protein [Lachnospiraceae bacterium]
MDNNNMNQNVNAPVDERKSKIAAGLLGIFLGCYGVHNFYLGYTKKAIIQVSVSAGCLVIGTALCWLILPMLLYFGLFGMGVWGLIEGIMILAGSINVDAKGIPLKE